MTRSLLSIAPVFFGLVIILSSCSNNIYSPITKRHYRKGFDINIAHRARPENARKTGKPEPSDAAISQQEVQNEESNPSLYVSADEDFSQFVVPRKPIELNTPPAKVVEKTSPAKPVIAKVLKPVKKARKAIRATSHSDDEALSLLWVVIVVILIVWLVAILAGGFGLGGLINLLLLIALILLILWLLRVI